MNGDKIIDEEQIIAERKQELLDLLKKLNEHYNIRHSYSGQPPQLKIKKHLLYGKYAYCDYISHNSIYLSYRAVLDDCYISTFLHEYAHILWFERQRCRRQIKDRQKVIREKQREIETIRKRLKTWNFGIPITTKPTATKPKKRERNKWHDDEFCLCLENILLFVFGDVWKYDFENHDYKCVKKWFEQKYKKKETATH